MPNPQAFVWRIFSKTPMAVATSVESKLRWKVEGYRAADDTKEEVFVRYMHPADVFDALVDIGDTQNVGAVSTLPRLATVFDYYNSLLPNMPSSKARHTPKFPWLYLGVRNQDKNILFAVTLSKVSEIRWKADCCIGDDPEERSLEVTMHPTDMLAFLCAMTVPENISKLETLDDLAGQFLKYDTLPYSEGRYRNEKGKHVTRSLYDGFKEEKANG